MDLSLIINPVLTVGVMGVLFGAGLGFAAIKLAVPQDPKVPLVRDALPGANCGGCGFAGCDALAEAIVAGEALVSACPVGGSKTAEAIGNIMGVQANIGERETAFVQCNGTCVNAKIKYDYVGIESCTLAIQLAGSGAKVCSFGCMGLGSCVKACEFDALHMENGIAVVDKAKCTACKKCVEACPKSLIELVPESKVIRVNCHSNQNGKLTKESCSVGCIGCKICEKNCPENAITVENFLAKIDYQKCTLCGTCVEKCPTKAIQKI